VGVRAAGLAGSLSLGERVGERDVAHDPSLDGAHRPSPLTPRPSPGQALPPRGEGDLAAGWSARLNLRFEPRAVNGNQRTVMSERNHFGPLRILKPLYPEGDAICHAVIVHPPGGIVAGDSLAVDLRVDSGAHALATTPGAQKWYRSTGADASAITRLQVADGASLEWMPQETIVFDGARASQNLEVALAPKARFFGWEMLCLGRTSRGERFTTGEFRQRIRLVRADGGAPLWRESMRLLGSDSLLDSPLGFRRLPVAATAWIALPDDASGAASAEVLANVRATLLEAPWAAASSPEPGLIVIKAMGDAPEAVRNLLVDVWKTIRLQVFAIDAVAPRIWST
jgi:urease accessory protein